MAKRRSKRPIREIKKNPNKINGEIRRAIQGDEVKLVGDGGEPIIMSFNKAMGIAEADGLDLVMVGDKATPPIVKIMDYSKYLYELNKKKKPNKSKPMKEVRFTPNTDDNDLKFKTKHVINFLDKGHRVKVFVFFRGREKAFKERGETLLLKLAVAVEEHGMAEGLPKMEGNKMNMFIKPIIKK